MKISITVKSTALLLSLAFLGGCQTLTGVHHEPSTKVVEGPPKFDITGKIGVSTKSADGVQAGSAFYTWGQVDGRFGIELTGALGMGATTISFDGQTAKLMSERTGEMSADSPEKLLQLATGWQAPVSQLAYWVMGRPAPNDTEIVYDADKLSQSIHDKWHAKFEYPKKSTHPNRLTIHHADGHKVVMTITHLNQTK